MVDETNVVVLQFGVIMAYAIVPKSILPSKWYNQKQSCHAKFKHKK